MIFAHGFQEFFLGERIKGTPNWFNSIEMKAGRLNADAAATTELGVGVLMTLGFFTPRASAAPIALRTVAIVTVHLKDGFFNVRNGQSVEYNLAVAVMALVAGAFRAGRYSLDYACNILHWASSTSVWVTNIVGLGGAAAKLATFYLHPSKREEASRPTLRRVMSTGLVRYSPTTLKEET